MKCINNLLHSIFTLDGKYTKGIIKSMIPSRKKLKPFTESWYIYRDHSEGMSATNITDLVFSEIL